MKRSSRPKTPFEFSASVHHQLSMYALTARAAGVGVLVLAQPAEAKIVYTTTKLPLMNQHQVLIDLNHDGIGDFSFYGLSYSNLGISTFFFRLTFSPAQQENAIWGVESHEHASCAAALRPGTRIGSKRPFQPDRLIMFDESGSPNGGTGYCPWVKGGTAYLGLKFSIKGKIHFGWARVKVTLPGYGSGATLTGYAYETVPNKPIIAGQTKGSDEESGVGPDADLTEPAPEPATLGLLALGSRGRSIWPREEFGTRKQIIAPIPDSSRDASSVDWTPGGTDNKPLSEEIL
jgi:hypothetical protein